jgi:8-oxo-dGTP pyrophosphatase MutT (NUDIX family)
MPHADPALRDTTRIAARIVDVVVLAPAPDEAFPARWRVLTLRRAVGTRCTGAWEIVHGRIEAGERPAEAAQREVFEETGFAVDRLYNLAVNPFYIPVTDTVQLALVFAAVVNADVQRDDAVALSEEHDLARWRTADEAEQVLAWPREHEAVRHAMWLLRSGDAGAVEDVLRAAVSGRGERVGG